MTSGRDGPVEGQSYCSHWPVFQKPRTSGLSSVGILLSCEPYLVVTLDSIHKGFTATIWVSPLRKAWNRSLTVCSCCLLICKKQRRRRWWGPLNKGHSYWALRMPGPLACWSWRVLACGSWLLYLQKFCEAAVKHIITNNSYKLELNYIKNKIQKLRIQCFLILWLSVFLRLLTSVVFPWWKW